jgi:hypothetical protein
MRSTQMQQGTALQERVELTFVGNCTLQAEAAICMYQYEYEGLNFVSVCMEFY